MAPEYRTLEKKQGSENSRCLMFVWGRDFMYNLESLTRMRSRYIKKKGANENKMKDVSTAGKQNVPERNYAMLCLIAQQSDMFSNNRHTNC
jgi:hypothetical protein